MKIISDVNDGLYNLLTPNIDKHLISLYNPTPELLIQVTRIKLIISNLGSFWLLNKFSLSAP